MTNLIGPRISASAATRAMRPAGFYRLSDADGSKEGGFSMKNLFEPAALQELKDRMERLLPGSERKWGKMSPGQALAHHSAQMEMVLGLTFPPRKLMGRLFGWYAKRNLLSEEPLPRNMPTDEAFVVNDERNLGLERERLRELLDRFVAGGPAACTKHPHSFLGPMTPLEWATLMYKHLDHHLRQFGV